MYRETDDFGVDMRGDELVIVQKGSGEKKPGEVAIDPKHLHLLGEWLAATRNELTARRKSVPSR